MNSQGNSGKVLNSYGEDELLRSSYEDLTDILQNNSACSKKVLCLNVLVRKFIKPPEDESFSRETLEEVVPYAKDLLNSLLEKTVELSFDNQHEKCVDTLEMIRKNLEMVVDLLGSLDDLLLFVINKNKVNFACVQSITLYVGSILYTTFLHCKESNNIYLIYVDSISEILLIFKKAQDVHFKLLRVLESHVVINVSNPKEISLLNEVLDNLLNIGILLSTMNVKSMADNWKGYTYLTQKYCDAVAKNIDLKRPLELLTSEILANLKGIFEMDMEDMKTVMYTLKIGSFITKVLLKLCFTFWKNTASNFDILWHFLVNLYSCAMISSKQQKCSEQVSNSIKLYLVDTLDSLIERLGIDEKFCQIDEITSESPLCCSGYSLFTNRLFQCWIGNLSDCDVDQFRLDVHLKNILHCFEKFQDIGDSYANLVTQISLLSLRLNDKNFLIFKEVLSKHFFSDNIFISIFVQDVLLSIIRLNEPKFSYDVLCNLVDKSSILIRSRFSNDIHIKKLSNFIHNVFVHLNTDYKMKFLTQYPITKNLSLWKRIGVDALPKSSRKDIEVLLLDTVQHIEKFLSRRCSLENFFDMVDLLVIVSTICYEETYFDLSKLSPLVIKLWSFECNQEMVESPFFDLLLEGMFKITAALMWKFNNEQQTKISDTIKSIMKSHDTARILAARLFYNRSIIVHSESSRALFANLGEIAYNLLTTDNIVLKSEGLQLIRQNSNTPARDSVVQQVLKKLPMLKSKYGGLLANTTNPQIQRPNPEKVTQLLKLQNRGLTHKCLEWSVESKTKRIKTENNEEIVKMLNSLEENADGLKELLKRRHLETEYVAKINAIISTLHLCLK